MRESRGRYEEETSGIYAVRIALRCVKKKDTLVCKEVKF